MLLECSVMRVGSHTCCAIIIVLCATRKLYINCLNVAPVVMCLSAIASFSTGSNGCIKRSFDLQFLHLGLYYYGICFCIHFVQVTLIQGKLCDQHISAFDHCDK